MLQLPVDLRSAGMVTGRSLLEKHDQRAVGLRPEARDASSPLVQVSDTATGAQTANYLQANELKKAFKV